MPNKEIASIAAKFWKEWVEADGLKRNEMLRAQVDKLFHGEREMLREMITMVLYDYTGDLEEYLANKHNRDENETR